MTGELYMFRMWDKANINLAKHCRDGSIVRWRKEDWMFNKTIEEDNSLPCVTEETTRPAEMTSDDTSESTETDAPDITDYHSTVTPVFYVGKVELHAREENNTSLNIEVFNNITVDNQVSSLIPIPAPTIQELSTIELPPHRIWIPFSHSPSPHKKSAVSSLKSSAFLSPTVISAKRTPTIRPLIPPFTENSFSETLSTSPTVDPLSETFTTATSSSTTESTTYSSTESLATPTVPTFPSVAFHKSVTATLSSTPATKSISNVALSIKSDATYKSKPITIISPAVDFTKPTTVSPSELPPKPPIAVPLFETTTNSFAQIPLATDSTQPVSDNKNMTKAPILPLTPFTITPTVSPVEQSVSVSHPYSTAGGHGSLSNGSTGKILSATTYTTSTYTTINVTTAEQIISKIEKDLAAGKVESEDVERMVSEVSKVLTASQQLPPQISNRVIKVVDYIGLKLNFSTMSADFSSPSLALAVVKTNSIRSSQMSFAVQDSSDLQISLGPSALHDLNNLGSITLPSSLLTNLPPEELDLASRIIFNLFKKTTVFQDLSLKNASLISSVISSSVANLTIRNLKTNVTVTLQNIRPNQDNSTVRCVFWDFNKNDFHLHIWSNLLGLPAVVVATVLAVSPDNYGLISTGRVSKTRPDEFCWIKNRIVFYITAVGYFCVIFLINVSMFIVVLIQLCRIKKKKQLGAQRKTSIQDLRSVAGLTFLLGITWGFAFFTVNEVFTYLFTIFNTLQGFFIFIFYCVTKENVRKQWRRYLCCGKFRLAENSGDALFVSTGHLSGEKNGVSFSAQNGDVCLQDFSGKQLAFQEKDDAGSQNSRISLRRTSKRGSLPSTEKM
ncbi:hypothetical protein ASZ78_006053 [Callipepla squamata]|uniref:Uncharacterized protein n=1 Tax=Callipepla squamata TaxID=9009 RepID=A0A226N7I0_CALSU|nr:hypothetical protein ASZ78_006053 [Callipepla squamata]